MMVEFAFLGSSTNLSRVLLFISLSLYSTSLLPLLIKQFRCTSSKKDEPPR